MPYAIGARSLTTDGVGFHASYRLQMVVSSPVGPMRLSIEGGWPQWSSIEKMSGTMTNGKFNSTERVLDALIADAAADMMGDALSLIFENARAFTTGDVPATLNTACASGLLLNLRARAQQTHLYPNGGDQIVAERP